jgi:hypothetical protein
MLGADDRRDLDVCCGSFKTASLQLAEAIYLTAIETAVTIFCCVFGGALAGMGLRAIIPKHHLAPETSDLIKLGVGLIGTMSALVLGLLVASTKSSYDTKKSELAQMAGNVILLDRILAHYGAEAADARDALRTTVAAMVGSNTSSDNLEQLGRAAHVDREVVFDKIQDLMPQTEAQRTLKSHADSLAINLGQTRWLLFAQSGTSISTPFLVIVVFWLTVLYLSFGLFAPANVTAFTTLFVSAVSVAGAMFLILELDHPFSGLMHIPDTPLRDALAVLGK